MEIHAPQVWEKIHPRLVAQKQQGIDLNEVAAFCEVNLDTVQRWLRGTPANGERLIRLWHLLALLGSDSPELRKLPAFNRYLAELLAFGVVSLDEACQIAGIKNTQSLFKITRGQPPMHPSFNLGELKQLYAPRLQYAKDQVQGGGAVSQPAEPPETVAPSGSPAMPSVPDLRQIVQHDNKLVLATLLGAALPLARYLDSPASSAQERSAFRDLVGQENLFDLSNLLNNLCSERARDIGRSGQR